MAKKIRSLRFSDRTWEQLERIAARYGVGDRTKAIEVWADREDAKMEAEMNLAELQSEAARIIRTIIENGRPATVEEFEFSASEQGWSQGQIDAVKGSPWLPLEKSQERG